MKPESPVAEKAAGDFFTNINTAFVLRVMIFAYRIK